MDQQYFNRLNKIFNEDRTDGHHEVKRNKAKFIFEVQDGNLVNADIYGKNIYDNKIHIQYDFYDDILIERIFEIQGRGKKVTEKLKSEVMENYLDGKRIRLLRKKYLLDDYINILLVEDGISKEVSGIDGTINTLEILDHGRILECYKFSKDGMIDLDMDHMVPSDLKPSKVKSMYQDYDQVVYEDPDYLLVLDKYPNGMISSLSLTKDQVIYEKIDFDQVGESKLEFHFDNFIVENAFSHLKFGKIINRRSNGGDVIIVM